MSKLTIFTEDRSFSISLPDKESCDKMFFEMLEKITGSVKTSPAPRISSITIHNTGLKEEKETEEVKEVPKTVSLPPVTQDGYRGFLYIECPHCGHKRGLYSKNPITTYHCAECGCDTKLEDLIPLIAQCECGKRWVYKTNAKEESFDITCIECGSPIAVTYNQKKNVYQNMR